MKMTVAEALEKRAQFKQRIQLIRDMAAALRDKRDLAPEYKQRAIEQADEAISLMHRHGQLAEAIRKSNETTVIEVELDG